jgi:allophanate hydrolase subunit 2
LLKGVIQVPADGNPIIMLSDHGTIGGYPKIAVVASVDYDRLVQISPGSKIKFKEIELQMQKLYLSCMRWKLRIYFHKFNEHNYKTSRTFISISWGL